MESIVSRTKNNQNNVWASFKGSSFIPLFLILWVIWMSLSGFVWVINDRVNN